MLPTDEALTLAQDWKAGTLGERDSALFAWVSAQDEFKAILLLWDVLGDDVSELIRASERWAFEGVQTRVRWYDDREGIEVALKLGLEGFNVLCRARHKAGYRRQEQMRDWLIAGRYWLSVGGNTLVSKESIEGAHVMRREAGDEWDGLFSMVPIARHDVTCTRCGLGWELKDAHDVRRSGDIDYHSECLAFEVHERVRARFEEIMGRLGLDVTLKAVPNRYGSQAWCGPWFVFDLQGLGRTCIGWRKRVIQITWTDGPDGRVVFANDDVTKDRRLVHAWKYDDAEAYLGRLLSATPNSRAMLSQRILARAREYPRHDG